MGAPARFHRPCPVTRTRLRSARPLYLSTLTTTQGFPRVAAKQRSQPQRWSTSAARALPEDAQGLGQPEHYGLRWCHWCAEWLHESFLYVDSLRHQLAICADVGGDHARALAERLTAPLESAARLVLLEVLSVAADEITRELAPGKVEVRLRGSDPVFVVTPPPGDDAFEDEAAGPGPSGTVSPVGGPTEGDDGGTSRLNLRLSDALKLRIEEAARDPRTDLRHDRAPAR